MRKEGAEGWTMHFDREPATVIKIIIAKMILSLRQISKHEIDCQERYEIEDLQDMDYPPRIVLTVRKAPQSLDAEPLHLRVEGLNKDTDFLLQPGNYCLVHIITPG